MLIDDDLDFITYLSDLMDSHSEYHVVGIARSGKEGMLAIEHFRPDLVIMDIMMPDNDGLKVIKYIREKCESYNPYIYVITAMETPLIRTILDDVEVDFADFKPFRNSETVTKTLEHIAHAKPKSLSEGVPLIPKNPVDIINDVLYELEIPEHLIGFEYIKTSLIFMLDNPALKRNVCSKTAVVFNRTSSCVAASIDTAIKACMDSDMYRTEFGTIKAEVLIFLNRLIVIVNKRMRESDKYDSCFSESPVRLCCKA